MNSQQRTKDQISSDLINRKVVYGHRRLVREKTLQTLFAYFISDTPINLLIENIFHCVFDVDNEIQDESKIGFESSNDVRLLSEEELKLLDSDTMIKWREEDVVFGKNMIFSVIKNYNIFSEYIKEASVNWDFERITIMDRTILMVAVAEFLFAEDVPIKVTINEAIELAKIYSIDKSPVFINGVLEKVKFILEDKKLINKSKRGMRQ